MSEGQLPSWAARTLPQLDGAERVGRKAVMVTMWVGVGVLIVWFVLGIITGFVQLQALVGAGSLGLVAEVLRRFTERKDRDG